MDRHLGFTLPELVFTLAIAAGLVGWGIPTFRDLQLNAERTREVNQFIQAVYLARSEAIKRNGVVSLCPSLDGQSCAPSGTPWQRGWMVFVNGDRDSPAVRDPGEELLRASEGEEGGTRDGPASRCCLYRPSPMTSAMLSFAVTPLASSADITLRATGRSSSVSCARNTSPMPPAPSRRTIR